MRSAAVIVEDRDGRVLLLLRGPTAPWMPMRWSLPGGRIEPGEAPADAASRELLEETALRVQALDLIASQRGLDVFYARRWSGRVELLDGENISHAWIPRAQIADWDVVPPHRETLRLFALARS